MFSCYHPVRQMSVVYNWGKDLRYARLSPRPPWSFRLSFSSQISPANHSIEGSLHTRNTTSIATRFVIDTKQDTPTRALTTEEVMCVMKTHPPIPADLLLPMPLSVSENPSGFHPNIHFHMMSEFVVSFEALPDFDTLQIPHFSAPHFIRYVGTGGRGVVTSGTKGATVDEGGGRYERVHDSSR